jgi:hypothetical protein
MANYNIYRRVNQMLIRYNPSEGEENLINIMTFFSPSIETKGDLIKFFESGVYKKSFKWTEIENIDGTQPSDSENATEGIIKLISELSYNTATL